MLFTCVNEICSKMLLLICFLTYEISWNYLNYFKFSGYAQDFGYNGRLGEYLDIK